MRLFNHNFCLLDFLNENMFEVLILTVYNKPLYFTIIYLKAQRLFFTIPTRSFIIKVLS